MDRSVGSPRTRLVVGVRGSGVSVLTGFRVTRLRVVSFAAEIRVVTQQSPHVSGKDRCVTTLIMAAKETTILDSIKWNNYPPSPPKQ